MKGHLFIILVMGLCVLAIRSMPFVLSRQLRLSDRVRSALDLVPAAVIAVILISAIMSNGAGAANAYGMHIRNPYLYGLLATILVAFLRGSFLLSIATGSAIFTAARLAFTG